MQITVLVIIHILDIAFCPSAFSANKLFAKVGKFGIRREKVKKEYK